MPPGLQLKRLVNGLEPISPTKKAPHQIASREQPKSSNVTLSNPPPAVDIDLAFFLLVRGPFAWIGFNWLGCDYEWWALPPQLRTEYGEPLGTFYETMPNKSGVFARNFTLADVELDCNTFSATILMK